MANQRKVSKELLRFGKREYREKRPIKVKILRIKDTATFKRGLLPTLVVKQRQAIQYVIITEYFEKNRIYLFSSNGILMGAENIENKSPVLEKLNKASKILYHIP
jgi:hypothetical protein